MDLIPNNCNRTSIFSSFEEIGDYELAQRRRRLIQDGDREGYAEVAKKKKRKSEKEAAGGQEQTHPAEGGWPPESSRKEDAVVLAFCSFKARWARAQSMNGGEQPRGETCV